MAPRSRSDEFGGPERSVGARIAGLVERTCVVAASWSGPLVLAAVGVLLVYAVGGFAVVQLGLWTPSYPFLSLAADVYFAWLAFLSGATICVGTGSLIGIALLEDGRGPVHNELSTLASFVGFGFGAAVVRMTYPTVIASVV